MSTPDQRTYVGRLESGRPAVYAVEAAAVEPLEPSTGTFAWGARAGDAGVELARALLTDASGSEPRDDVCRRFADQILRRIPGDGFVLRRETVNAWLRRFVAV